jgi:hypothetical protein
MCCLRVSGFLTEITQQIHSLRASGVISSHFALATGSEMRTLRKSAGKLCTAPGEIALLVMDFILPCYAISPGVLGCNQAETPGWSANWTGSPVVQLWRLGLARRWNALPRLAMPAKPGVSLRLLRPVQPDLETKHWRELLRISLRAVAVLAPGLQEDIGQQKATL